MHVHRAASSAVLLAALVRARWWLLSCLNGANFSSPFLCFFSRWTLDQSHLAPAFVNPQLRGAATDSCSSPALQTAVTCTERHLDEVRAWDTSRTKFAMIANQGWSACHCRPDAKQGEEGMQWHRQSSNPLQCWAPWIGLGRWGTPRSAKHPSLQGMTVTVPVTADLNQRQRRRGCSGLLRMLALKAMTRLGCLPTCSGSLQLQCIKVARLAAQQRGSRGMPQVLEGSLLSAVLHGWAVQDIHLLLALNSACYNLHVMLKAATRR